MLLLVGLSLSIDLLNFQPFTIIFAQLRNFWGYDHLTVGLVRVLSEVVLMIVFCLVESFEWHDLSHDWGVPNMRRFNLFNHLFRYLLLFSVMIENYRSVLCSHVSSLSIHGGGVVNREEYLQYFLE